MGLALRVLLQAPRHLGAGQPGCWPLLPSELALPSLGNHVGSSSACGLWLCCWSPVPKSQTQGGPTVSGTWGTGFQEEAWLEGSSGSVSESMGPGPSRALPFVL